MAEQSIECVNAFQQKSYIKSLHDNYHGVQDKYFCEPYKSVLKRPKYKDVIETLSATAEPSAKEVRFRIKGETKGGIANILIKSEKWEKAVFYIYKEKIAEIYNAMGINTFPITDNGYCIPFGGCYDMHIAVLGVEEPITIEYDYVDFDFGKDWVCEFMYKTPVIGPKKSLLAQGFHQEIKLTFGGPIAKVITKFNKNVEKVYIRFMDDYEKHIPFKKLSNTEFQLDFEGITINFSRIYSATLVILNLEDDNSIFCYAETYHVIRAMSGIYGRAFSD